MNRMPVQRGSALARGHGRAGGQTRATPAALLAAAVLLALVAPLGPAAAANARPPRLGWYPALGPAWFFPVDPTVRRIYTAGPGVAGGVGYAWNEHLGAEVRLGWFRRDGIPETGLAETAESRLQLIPFTAEFLWRSPLTGGFAGDARWNAFAAVGPAVVFSREEFEYRLAGSSIRAAGRRSDPAATLSLGLEGCIGETGLGWRLAARGLLASGRRKVLRPGGRSDPRDSAARPSQVSLGLELAWR